MSTDSRFELPEKSARQVVLTVAVDEIDRDGELVPLEVRLRITRDEAAGAEESDGVEAWLVPRAERLARALVSGSPSFRVAADGWSTRGLVAACWLGAFAVGLSSNVLGPERGISVLAPPLLGLILWNLGLFMLLLARSLRARLIPPGLNAAGGHRVAAWIRRLRLRQLPAQDSIAGQVLRRHLQLWSQVSAPLSSARLTAILHVAAALMVSGTVAGMYLRGLALEYRASWESTFLSPAAVDHLLAWVLWPASRLVGLDLPSVATLQAPADGPAAPWIHAWAATAGLVVVGPRCLLAAAAALRGARLGRRLPVPLSAIYLQRLRSAASTRQHEVLIVPYSFRPPERSADALRALLADLVGARARVRLAPTVAYGEAVSPPETAWLVLVFNLAQTPEIEVHGELLGVLRERLADGQQLLALVDEAPLSRRTPAEQLAERLQSRRRAWRRVVEGAGLRPAFLALGAPEGHDQALEALAAAVFPPTTAGDEA